MRTVRMIIKKLQKCLKQAGKNGCKGSRIAKTGRIYMEMDRCGNSLGGRE